MSPRLIDYLGKDYWDKMVEGGPSTSNRPIKTDKKINFLLRVIFLTDILQFFGKEDYEKSVSELNLSQTYNSFGIFKKHSVKSSISTYKKTEKLHCTDGNLLFIIWCELMLNYCPLRYFNDFFPTGRDDDKSCLHIKDFKFCSVDDYDESDKKYIPPMLFSTFFELVKTKNISLKM